MNEKDEAIKFLKQTERTKGSMPNKEKNILDWSLIEYKTYFTNQTKGMSMKNKLKFGEELLKKVEVEKAKRKIANQ